MADSDFTLQPFSPAFRFEINGPLKKQITIKISFFNRDEYLHKQDKF